MIEFNGNIVNVTGEVVSLGYPVRVVVKLNAGDAHKLRCYVEPFFKETDPKYRPGWLDGKKNVLAFRSRYNIQVTTDSGEDINGLDRFLERYGVTRGSKVVVQLKISQKGQSTGVFIKGLEFIDLKSVTLDNFWGDNRDFSDLEEESI